MLAMLISVPIFSTDTYMDDNNSYLVAMNMMINFPSGDPGFNSLFKSFIENQVRIDTPIILANCRNVTWESGLDVSFEVFNLFTAPHSKIH